MLGTLLGGEVLATHLMPRVKFQPYQLMAAAIMDQSLMQMATALLDSYVSYCSLFLP